MLMIPSHHLRQLRLPLLLLLLLLAILLNDPNESVKLNPKALRNTACAQGVRQPPAQVHLLDRFVERLGPVRHGREPLVVQHDVHPLPARRYGDNIPV